MIIETPVAVHEARDEEKVVKFLQPHDVPEKVQHWIWEGQFWGAYYDDGDIVFENIWQETIVIDG